MVFSFMKPRIGLQAFCREFYDSQLLHPKVAGVDAGDVFPELVRATLAEVCRPFETVSTSVLRNELTTLRYELFALAWTHKFVSGEIVILQSAFTKTYLHEDGRDDLWAGMDGYNKLIDGATLHWLSTLGKGNLTFNYGMRRDLAALTHVVALKKAVRDEDVVERACNRIWSENAWKDRLMLEPLAAMLCERVGMDPRELSTEATFRLAAYIHGLYEGARQSWAKAKIVV